MATHPIDSTADPMDAATRDRGRAILARLERLNVWSLSYLFIGVIGLGFLFTYYDIFVINVSFIQTCTQIKGGCTPENALNALRLPLVLNLAGYMVGGLVLSSLSDRFGRREMLMITMIITGLGSLYNALGPGYVNFNIARIITGIGIGADLAIVNTYINEVAPRRGRARYMSVIFTLSAVGAALGIWLGLILTTGAEHWPLGLPFALAGENFDYGWRVMYGIGALLAVVAVLLRFELPESPRWLINRRRLDDAEHVVAGMEHKAARHGTLDEPDPAAIPVDQVGAQRAPYRELFVDRRYLRRMLLLLAVYLIGYVTVYAYAAGFTSVLTGLSYPPPEAGLITALGVAGFIAQGFVNVYFVERLDRRLWMPLCALITLVGAVILAEAGTNFGIAILGSILIFFGFNGWFPAVFTLTAESFPTRARATGFAVADSVGHIGGGIGILIIAPALPHLSTLTALMYITGFLVVASLLVQFAPQTRSRPLHEISP
jgi:MFS family permease